MVDYFYYWAKSAHGKCCCVTQTLTLGPQRKVILPKAYAKDQLKSKFSMKISEYIYNEKCI